MTIEGPAPSGEAEAADKSADWGRILGYVLGNNAAWIIDIGLRTGLLARVGAGRIRTSYRATSGGREAPTTPGFSPRSPTCPSPTRRCSRPTRSRRQPTHCGHSRRGGTLLEIGPGAGHHLIHHARTYPNARIEGIEFDLPSVEIARAAVVEAGLAERIAVRHGDANALDDVERHDLVVMNITLHETGGRDDWLNVLQRARSALRPGGSVLVSELPYPDRVVDYRSDAVYQMLAGVQLHESVVGCGMITQRGLRDLSNPPGA